MVMDELRTLCDQMKKTVTMVTALKKRKLDLEVVLRQSTEHAAAAKKYEDAIKKEVATINEELTASRVESVNLRWGQYETI